MQSGITTPIQSGKQWLPEEITVDIFYRLDRTSLEIMHLVCHHFRKVSYSPELYQRLLEKVAVLPEDWKEYANVIPGGDQPFALTSMQVPRWVLISERPEDHAITWMPEFVTRTIKNDQGSDEVQTFFLKTAEEVQGLIAGTEIGSPADFHENSWSEALKAEWEVEKSHWEWIDFRPFAQGQAYNVQENRVKEEKGNAADVSMRRASFISLLMHKKKFGKRCAIFDGGSGAYIRFKDLAEINGQKWRIEASFVPFHLFVDYHYAVAHDSVAVAVARKFFGPWKLGS